jgi:DNA polymerase I-like protein with 3'-5' exonuclease and polymerase domains
MNLALDFETTTLPNIFPWMPSSFAVTLHLVSDTGIVANYIFNHNDNVDCRSHTDMVAEIQELFNREPRLIAHNMKFDLHWLTELGLDTSMCSLYCTQVAEYILSGQSAVGNLDLATLSTKYGIADKHDKVKEYWDSGYETEEIPLDVLIPYGEQDARNALVIAQAQWKLIAKAGLSTLVSMDMEALRYLQQIEYNGMRIDVDLCKRYAAEYDVQIAGMNTQLNEIFGYELNFNSNPQLSAALYGGTFQVEGRVPGKREGTMKNGKVAVTLDGIGFVPLEGTETATEGIFKVDLGTLMILKAKTKVQKEVIRLLIERSRLEKLRSTYFVGMAARVIDGYVHPNMNQTIARTGRLTSSNPNGQNIPRGTTGPAKMPFISRY